MEATMLYVSVVRITLYDVRRQLFDHVMEIDIDFLVIQSSPKTFLASYGGSIIPINNYTGQYCQNFQHGRLTHHGRFQNRPCRLLEILEQRASHHG
jgi:hypothetical protein